MKLTDNQTKILQYLSQGMLCSGSDLAEKLQLSRTAIWKNIKQIQLQGFEVIVHDKKGYQLPEPLDFYDVDRIQTVLPQQLYQLHYQPQTTSTNDLISFDTTMSTTPWQLALTEQQLAGRGRRGRQWSSPFAKHIYMSLGFLHQNALEQLQGLSLLVGLTVQSFLSKEGLTSARVKWPNDVWCDGKKLAGILVEIKGEAHDGYQVIVGLGLNVHPDHSLTELDACCVQDYLPLTKMQIVQQLVPELTTAIELLKHKGFIHFKDAFDAAHLFHHRDVLISEQDVERVGRVLGVNHDGGLLVDIDGKTECLYASEIKKCRMI